jgi:hypothetical protein
MERALRDRSYGGVGAQYAIDHETESRDRIVNNGSGAKAVIYEADQIAAKLSARASEWSVDDRAFGVIDGGSSIKALNEHLSGSWQISRFDSSDIALAKVHLAEATMISGHAYPKSLFIPFWYSYNSYKTAQDIDAETMRYIREVKEYAMRAIYANNYVQDYAKMVAREAPEIYDTYAVVATEAFYKDCSDYAVVYDGTIEDTRPAVWKERKN